MPTTKRIPILFEDEHLLVIDKPAGLLAIPDRYDPDRPNALSILRQAKGEIHAVHRIDRGTSGVLLFARNSNAVKNLSHQFEHRHVDKKYHALVQGRPSDEQGTITDHIARSGGSRMVVHHKGKAATTHFQVMEYFRNHSWVEVEIETGRTHQIRVHFAHQGFPLAVDRLYGRKNELYLSEIKTKNFQLGENQTERPLLSRLSLHAQRLSFSHPLNKEEVTIEAPLPKDLKAVLNQLRKWSSIK